MGCMEALDDELLNMRRRMEALDERLLNTTRHNVRDDAASAAVRAIVLELGEAGATAVLPAFDARPRRLSVSPRVAAPAPSSSTLLTASAPTHLPLLEPESPPTRGWVASACGRRAVSPGSSGALRRP